MVVTNIQTKARNKVLPIAILRNDLKKGCGIFGAEYKKVIKDYMRKDLYVAPPTDPNSGKVSVYTITDKSGNKSTNNIYETDRVVYKESKYDKFMRRVKLPGKVKPLDFNK